MRLKGYIDINEKFNKMQVNQDRFKPCNYFLRNYLKHALVDPEQEHMYCDVML